MSPNVHIKDIERRAGHLQGDITFYFGLQKHLRPLIWTLGDPAYQNFSKCRTLSLSDQEEPQIYLK